MLDISNIRAHQKAFLAKAKEQKEVSVYTIEGIKIAVYPGVFPPATDTKLLASHIRLKPGERILDVTSGAGVFSVIAGLQGATGIAVDINPKAVINSEENFKKYNVQIMAIRSDLFQYVPKEKFDYIFANGPFFEGNITDPIDYACYGARKFLTDLFQNLKNHLKSSGKLLIVVSEWSDLDFFITKVKSNNLESRLVATRESDDGERRYRLYEIRLK